MLKFTTPVAISGTGYSKVSRSSDDSLGALAVEAAMKAADEAGISVRDIDGLSVFPFAARYGSQDIDGVDTVSAGFLNTALHMKSLRWTSAIFPGSFIGSVIEAVNAVAAGACKHALVWRAMHNPKGKFGRYHLARASGADQFQAPYGLVDFITGFALPYSEYLAKYGAKRDHLATYIVNNRANAAKNPDAVFYQKPITREDYLNAQMISEPMCILDCDMPVDSCGAVIVTNADNAKSARFTPVYIGGYATIVPQNGHWFPCTLDTLQECSANLGDVLWESAGLSPKDVSMVNLYDGFSIFTYLYLEGLRFCKVGEAFEFIQGGRIEVDGEFPMNTSGGSLGMGRLHGPPQVIESVRQIQGRCGERQVTNREVNVVAMTTGSPRLSPGAMVLTKEPLH